MTRGIYCVAFGVPAREAARTLIASVKAHMPDVPVALCSTESLGLEDVLIVRPDSDVGGRRAKLMAYELAPADWESVLYLDADTEVVADVSQLFRWVEDGWDFAICRDVGESLHSFQRKNNLAELAQLQAAVGLNVMQYNGGVWVFRRCDAMRRFFARWLAEWEVHGQRDQGALVRALHADPVRILVLGGEWNTCMRPDGRTQWSPRVRTAGIMHYPGAARRWVGKIPGRIDAPEAWRIVRDQNVQAGRRA